MFSNLLSESFRALSGLLKSTVPARETGGLGGFSVSASGSNGRMVVASPGALGVMRIVACSLGDISTTPEGCRIAVHVVFRKDEDVNVEKIGVITNVGAPR